MYKVSIDPTKPVSIDVQYASASLENWGQSWIITNKNTSILQGAQYSYLDQSNLSRRKM